MICSRKWQILLLLLTFLTSVPSWSSTLKIAVFSDHFKVITTTFKNKGCADTDEYLISDNQMLAEFMILCSALKDSGFESFEFLPYPIMDRALEALAEGDADIIGFGVWRQDAIKHKLLISMVVLARGEFTKGLYSTKDIIDKYSKTGTQKFTELIVVANKNWTHDWAALSCTGLNLLHVDRYQQMFNMVSKKRAELVPLTFGAKPGLVRKEFGIALFPMPGMKLAFDQSLHIAVSPSLKDGKLVLESLNRGITRLTSNGKISRVYGRLGLTNPKTKDWQVIGC